MRSLRPPRPDGRHLRRLSSATSQSRRAMPWRPALLVIILLLAGLRPAMAAAVDTLRCEYRDDPLGIDVAQPRLSWLLHDERRGARQSAWRVLVASTLEALGRDQGDLWDSGRVEDDRSIQLAYAGQALVSRQQCYWKVQVWDQVHVASAWSAAAHWSMGLLRPEDWHSHWIGYDAASRAADEQAHSDALLTLQGLKWVGIPATLGTPGVDTCLRRQIDLPADRHLIRATLALYGFHECTALVNGTVIGHAAQWEPTARLEATASLHPGANVIGIIASHTDRYLPQAIGRLVLHFDAGTDQAIPMDQSWKASQQPGDGWSRVGYDDGTWPAAAAGGVPWAGPAPVADLPRIPAPYLRTTFSVPRAVVRATAFVTALGAYELQINGRRVGEDVLAPGWTEFRKRVCYQTYDVTDLVATGANAVGAILGDGWYASDLAHLAKRNVYGGAPRLLVQLMLDFSDGSTQVVASGPDWKASYGPIRHADLLMGCAYDARLAMPGWSTASFDDRGWKPVEDGGPATQAGGADVSETLRAAISGGRLAVTVDNALCGGDPAPGVVKELTITTRQDGREQEHRIAEGARLEIGSAEKPVAVVHARYAQAGSASQRRLQAAVAEPARILDRLPARTISEPKPGRWTFDLGQNMVGWVRLVVHGRAGSRITVRHGEMLNPDGTIYTASLRSCPATDFYILSGAGEEVLEPYFTFHGLRYVEVRGLGSAPTLDAVTGMVVHTPLHRTGQFACSNPLIDRLYSCIIWGQLGNHLEIPTDCPQRDERMGWTGDTQFFAPTGAYNFDVAAFFTRWLQTCEDDQHPDGTFPHVVPDIMGGGGATAWGDAALLCTYTIYRTYGDTRIIADRFAAMDRYMQWLAGKTSAGIAHVGGFGDWLNAGGGATSELIDTAYYAHLARIMSEMAAAIGRSDDAKRYAQWHAEEKAAFTAAFLQQDGSLKGSSQTAYALAFTMDLLPAERRAQVADRFIDQIKRFDWHLATGFIGTPRLLPALSLAGRDDVAYRLLLTDTYPSWLFPVKNGATTMWERWDGWTPDKGFGAIGMNSYNHYAFGAVGEYLYGGVGGIQAGTPGYKTIVIHPVVRDGLSWATTAFLSPYGSIGTDWKRDGGTLALTVTIPVNTSATVFVPRPEGGAVTEGGLPLGQAPQVTVLRHDPDAEVLSIGSGRYTFVSRP